MEHERHKCSACGGTGDCPELQRNGPESRAFSGLNLGMEDSLVRYTRRRVLLPSRTHSAAYYSWRET